MIHVGQRQQIEARKSLEKDNGNCQVEKEKKWHLNTREEQKTVIEGY